jgi:cytochrome c oxidase assembly factor CtaG
VPRLVASLTPIIDQTLAGAVLMVLGKATFLVAGLAVFFRWFGREHAADSASLGWHA